MFYARNPRERELLAGTLISVVGCGSFGSALAEMLVRAGVGRLILIDPETLSGENLGRHILTGRDLGRPKVEAVADRLLEVNPELQVEARREKFRDGDGLLLSCVDSRRCESMITAVSLAKQLPAVFVGAYGAVRAAEIQICLPGQTACRECFARFRGWEEIPAAAERYTDPDFDETRAPGQSGLWGSVLAVGGIAFHAVLALLGVRGGFDPGRPLWIANLDYEGLQPYAVTFVRVPRGCPVCDEGKMEELTVEGSAV